jgi:hypothetical protein
MDGAVTCYPHNLVCFVALAGFKEGARAGFEWAALRAAAKTAGIIAKHLPNAEQAAPRV